MRLSKLAVLTSVVVSVFAILPGCGAETLEEEERGETESAINAGNDRVAFKFFLAKGLTKNQAAGVIGNLEQESGMNPKSKQLGGGPGRGIAQWSVNERWAKHTARAKQKGVDPLTLNAQLDFLWHELETVPANGLAALKKATTVTAAVIAFQDKFERCGKCETSKRVKFANEALAAFGNETAAEPEDDGKEPTGDEDPAVTNPPVDEDFPADNLPAGIDSMGDCMVDGELGACISTTDCKSLGGVSTRNLCPGGKNIQCCTPGN